MHKHLTKEKIMHKRKRNPVSLLFYRTKNDLNKVPKQYIIKKHKNLTKLLESQQSLPQLIEKYTKQNLEENAI